MARKIDLAASEIQLIENRQKIPRKGLTSFINLLTMSHLVNMSDKISAR